MNMARSSPNGDPPESPTDLSGRSWFGVLKRSVTEFREDNLTDWAAAPSASSASRQRSR